MQAVAAAALLRNALCFRGNFVIVQPQVAASAIVSRRSPFSTGLHACTSTRRPALLTEPCSEVEVNALLQYVANQLKSSESLDLLVLKEMVQTMTVRRGTGGRLKGAVETLGRGMLDAGGLSSTRARHTGRRFGCVQLDGGSCCTHLPCFASGCGTDAQHIYPRCTIRRGTRQCST